MAVVKASNHRQNNRHRQRRPRACKWCTNGIQFWKCALSLHQESQSSRNSWEESQRIMLSFWWILSFSHRYERLFWIEMDESDRAEDEDSDARNCCEDRLPYRTFELPTVTSSLRTSSFSGKGWCNGCQSNGVFSLCQQSNCCFSYVSRVTAVLIMSDYVLIHFLSSLISSDLDANFRILIVSSL